MLNHNFDTQTYIFKKLYKLKMTSKRDETQEFSETNLFSCAFLEPPLR